MSVMPKTSNTKSSSGSRSNMNLLFMGSFIGAIVLVVIGIVVYGQMQNSRVKELSAKFSNWNKKTGIVVPFTAYFPGPTESKLETLELEDGSGSARQEMLSHTDEATGDQYVVNAMVYPVDVEPQDKEKKGEYLQALIDNVVQSIEGEIVTKRIGDAYGQNTEASFVVYQSSSEVYYKGKFFVDGDTVYQVWVTDTSKEEDETDEYFLKSFKKAE